MIGPQHQRQLEKLAIFSGVRTVYMRDEIAAQAAKSTVLRLAIDAAGGLDMFWHKTEGGRLPIAEWDICLPDPEPPAEKPPESFDPEGGIPGLSDGVPRPGSNEIYNLLLRVHALLEHIAKKLAVE